MSCTGHALQFSRSLSVSLERGEALLKHSFLPFPSWNHHLVHHSYVYMYISLPCLFYLNKDRKCSSHTGRLLDLRSVSAGRGEGEGREGGRMREGRGRERDPVVRRSRASWRQAPASSGVGAPRTSALGAAGDAGPGATSVEGAVAAWDGREQGRGWRPKRRRYTHSRPSSGLLETASLSSSLVARAPPWTRGAAGAAGAAGGAAAP